MFIVPLLHALSLPLSLSYTNTHTLSQPHSHSLKPTQILSFHRSTCRDVSMCDMPHVYVAGVYRSLGANYYNICSSRQFSPRHRTTSYACLCLRFVGHRSLSLSFFLARACVHTLSLFSPLFLAFVPSLALFLSCLSLSRFEAQCDMRHLYMIFFENHIKKIVYKNKSYIWQQIPRNRKSYMNDACHILRYLLFGGAQLNYTRILRLTLNDRTRPHPAKVHGKSAGYLEPKLNLFLIFWHRASEWVVALQFKEETTRWKLVPSFFFTLWHDKFGLNGYTIFEITVVMTYS